MCHLTTRISVTNYLQTMDLSEIAISPPINSVHPEIRSTYLHPALGACCVKASHIHFNWAGWRETPWKPDTVTQGRIQIPKRKGTQNATHIKDMTKTCLEYLSEFFRSNYYMEFTVFSLEACLPSNYMSICQAI